MSVLKSRLAVSVAVAGLAMPGAAYADNAPDSIVVSANRQEQRVSEVAQSVTVVTKEEIETRQSIAVTDILRTVPGVRVTANGGLGGITSVFIRGGSADHTVALIDGVKINDPASVNGAYDFGNLLSGNIERIEVLRGAQSVLWGSQAIGGVVNIITREPTEDLEANGSAEYGWRDTARVVGNMSGKFGPVSASVGGNFMRSDGFSAFNAYRGGEEKDGYRNYGGNAKVNVAINDAISLDLRGWYSNAKTHVDGYVWPTGFADTPEYSRMKEYIGYAGLNVALLDGRWRNRIAYNYTNTQRTTFDPRQVEEEAFRSRGRNERFEYQGNLKLTDQIAAVFGAETEKSRLFTRGYGSVSRFSTRQNSFYGQLELRPVTGLIVTGGVRRDDHDDFGGKTSLAASGVYTPNDGQTTFRATYSEGFKAPSLYQLHSDYGTVSLRPETSKGWDAGITQLLVDGRIELGATWFQRNTHNMINFINCAADAVIAPGICFNRPWGTYDNVDRGNAKGVEATIVLRPTDSFTVQGEYSWVKSTDRTTGLDLARRPRHSVSLLVDYAWSFGLTTGATVTNVSASYDKMGEVDRLQGYVLVDLRASFPITDRIEVFGRVENLFNERYETTLTYGTARRAAYGGVRWKI